jgi:hypothetical protein
LIGGLKRIEIMHNFSKIVELFLSNTILLHAYFAELGVQEEHIKFIIRNRSMEDSQVTYIHEEEVKGMHVSLGNEVTKSNGHRRKKIL